MAGYFELKATSDGRYLFNLKAGNSQVILTSETYSTKAGAMAGIESVKANAPSDARYERKTTKNNAAYFVLKAANGEPIGRSEMYSSASAMEGGIASVKANALASMRTDRPIQGPAKAGSVSVKSIADEAAALRAARKGSAKSSR